MLQKLNITLICALLTSSFAYPQQMVMGPNIGQSPLLWVNFIAPEGIKTTIYPGNNRHVTLNGKQMAGLRPGYVYRVKLDHIPGNPESALYPTLEVRGSLHMPKVANPLNFPAPIKINRLEIESALKGNLITKIVYLEDSEKAESTTTTIENPIESYVPTDANIFKDASERGRVMVIIRMGGRIISEQELQANSIAGTVQIEGEKFLAAPRFPPIIPCESFQFFDPKLGPRFSKAELVYDGGDQSPMAGFDKQGNLQGVNPEDTVAEYTDNSGKKRIARSNRVILSAPRFAILAQETIWANVNTVQTFNEHKATIVDSQYRSNTPSLQARAMNHLNSFKGDVKIKGTENLVALGEIQRLEVLRAQIIELMPRQSINSESTMTAREKQKVALKRQTENVKKFSTSIGLRENESIEGTSVVARIDNGPVVVKANVQTREIVITEDEAHEIETDKPLALLKLADKPSAKVGDIVTFTLRYTNLGSKPMSDIAVIDSLATRLEYVPSSAISDRDAVFTMQKNESGSLVLRWEITGKLMPKEYGIIRFQARVR